MNWYLAVLKKYAEFDGRARREEYWMYTLFHLIALLITAGIGLFIMNATDSPAGFALAGIYVLATFIPSLAVTIRRLHDTGKSGWYYLVSFIPYIGSIWLIILLVKNGDSGSNEYGPDPKDESAPEESGILDSGMIN